MIEGINNRCIAPEHMTDEMQLVPSEIQLPFHIRQGDVIDFGSGFGSVLQFFTGNEFRHYVCVLDFEDWGDEKCPRFSYYVKYDMDEVNSYYILAIEPSMNYDWKLIREDGE